MQQIGTDVAKDVGDFLKQFTLNYIRVLVNSKLGDIMDDAVDKVMPSAFKEKEDDTGVEEKKEEEKKQDPPIAAGTTLLGHRLAYGPDRAYHRYYDFGVWCIRKEDSVISKVVRRHKPVMDWAAALKRAVPEAPDAEFPKKKLFGKNNEYYINRYVLMRNYFRVISPIQAASTSDYFLSYWNLKYDETRAKNQEIFFKALKVTCEEGGVDWNTAKWRAQTIGLDMDEVEMLKVVAVEKVGERATQRIRDQVYASNYIPGPVKGKFIASSDAKLAGIISTAVENGWGAAQESFNKVVDALSEALNKGLDPIKDLVGKVLEPVGKIVKEKFDKLDKLLEADDGLDREVKAARFPPLAAALQGLADGKAIEVVKKLNESINKMSAAHNYVGYLRYNLGDPEIGQYIPYLNEIQENHFRLTIALTDMAYVMSRAGVNAFEPLLKYLDKISESGFDEKSHEKEIQDAVREGGRRLSIDYFSLPQTVDRACWYCGYITTSLVMKVAQNTTWGIADLLGTIASDWKPTTKENAKEKFIEVLKEPLDSFINTRVKTFVSVVRKATANIIARQLMSVVGDAINSIADTLNDLVKNLPSPIGDNLKPGDLVKYLLEKMADNCVTIGVKILAAKTEAIMYSENGVANALDEWEVRRLRWEPRIRNYDDDNVEPEPEDKKKEDTNANANANANADTTTATTTTNTDTTTTNTDTTTTNANVDSATTNASTDTTSTAN